MTYTHDQIRKLLSVATSGQWSSWRRSDHTGYGAGAETNDSCFSFPNAALIAAAPAIIQQLLDELESKTLSFADGTKYEVTMCEKRGAGK